jgi:meso-butanediol dehydrogenase/(S,S)-butanediol dehydrogenase/diacetyl reductase
MTSQPQRVAIITGSAIGIGEAIALKLAEDGYNIVLNDLPTNQTTLASVANKIGEKGRKAVVIVGDVSAENDVKHLVKNAVYELGRVDVVSQWHSHGERVTPSPN